MTKERLQELATEHDIAFNSNDGWTSCTGTNYFCFCSSRSSHELPQRRVDFLNQNCGLLICESGRIKFDSHNCHAEKIVMSIIKSMKRAG